MNVKRPVKKLLYYCGINEGADEHAYIGRDFRPGLWIPRNFLWNTDLAHRGKALRKIHDLLNSFVLRFEV